MTSQLKNLNKFIPSLDSIKGRLLLASIILLPLFCAALGLSLSKAFSVSMKSNEKAQLLLQAYALISSAELINHELWLPEQLSEDKFNQASSGLFAFIYSGKTNQLIWQSPSAINTPLIQNWRPLPLASGKHLFNEIEVNGQPHFALQYSVTWENMDQDNLTFQFVVFYDQKAFQEQVLTYQKNLWGWLVAIALLITIVQTLILKWGLRPILEVANDLQAIQNGEKSQLTSQYPKELREMTASINTLLTAEAEQRKRYKDALANLAHSLKTPLAIMHGSLYELSSKDTTKPLTDHEKKSLAKKELTQQLNRIDQIVSYQLKRSVITPRNPFSNTIDIRSLCEKVIASLRKVYRDQPIHTHIKGQAMFKGDEDDMLEILGNLLDNSFKYGKNQILIELKQTEQKAITILIEDNGHGVPDAIKKQVLQRGERADTSQAGQGIGLAVVTDIVGHYGGSLKLETSSLGGLAVIIEL